MKKINSILLTVIMIFSSVFCVNVSAAETDSEKTAKLKNNLEWLIYFTKDYFGKVGECRPFYDSDVYNLACDLERVSNDKNSTYRDLLDAYDELMYAINNMQIYTYFSEETYKLSLKEQNYNNRYSEEDWSIFVKNRDALKEALDMGLDSKITEAFYDLPYCYNVMTNRYKLRGDVNKDGEVNVIDAILVQKYLAGLENFTGAQRMLCCEYNYENFNISAATTSEPYESYERRMERTMNFIICPRTSDRMYLIDNGYYDTKFLNAYFYIYYQEI